MLLSILRRQRVVADGVALCAHLTQPIKKRSVPLVHQHCWIRITNGDDDFTPEGDHLAGDLKP